MSSSDLVHLKGFGSWLCLSMKARMSASSWRVADAPGEALEKLGVRYLAELVGRIALDHLVMPRVQQAVNASHRVRGAPSRPVGVLLRLQVGFEYRLKHEQGRCLRHPIPDATEGRGSLTTPPTRPPQWAKFSARSASLVDFTPCAADHAGIQFFFAGIRGTEPEGCTELRARVYEGGDSHVRTEPERTPTGRTAALRG